MNDKGFKYTNLMHQNNSYRQPSRPSYSPHHSYTLNAGFYNTIPHSPLDVPVTARNSMAAYNYRSQEGGPDYCPPYQPLAISTQPSQ